MVKRLRPQSGSETESDDEAPAARRMRLSALKTAPAPEAAPNAKTTFSGLPMELRTAVFVETIDSRDVIGSLKGLGRLSRVSRSFKEDVDFHLKDGRALKVLNTKLETITGRLDHLTGEPHDGDRKASRQAHLRSEAALLPLQSPEVRRYNVASILRYKDGDFDHEAVRNVIGNLNYVDQDMQSRVVGHVREHQDEDGFCDALFSDLCDKADVLSPRDRNNVLPESLKITDAEIRINALSKLADKAHLFDGPRQRDILEEALEQCDGKALAQFAEHAGKLTAGNRSTLVDAVRSLPEDDAYKPYALGHLVRRGASLGDQRSEVVKDVLSNFEKPDTMNDDIDEQDWHTQPRFCKYESVRDITNSSEVPVAQREAARAAIALKLRSPNPVGTDPDADSVRAQLIDHLSPDARKDFTQSRLLNEDRALPDGVVRGLAARFDALNSTEQRAYIGHVDRLSRANDAGNEATSYMIRNKLAVCDTSQRSVLIKRQTDAIAEYEDPSYAKPALAGIAANARYLRSQDVNVTVDAAIMVAEQNLRELPINSDADASIRSCAGYAARCVSNWASEQLRTPAMPRAKSAPSSRLDDRTRENSNIR